MLSAVKPDVPINNHSEQKIYYQVVHIMEGRYRIRIPRLMDDPEYALKLNWLFQSLDFIISVRINSIAGSVVIDYDPCGTTTEEKEQIFAAIQQAYFVEMPSAVAEQPEQTDLRPEIDWTERMGLPVASLGLALLASQLALPIPAVVLGGAVVAAAVPFFNRVFDTTVKERRLDADILDALWLTLYTVKGDFVAPALMVSMIESGSTLR